MGSIAEILKKNIKVIPNFPKKGIMFQDIFSLIGKPRVFSKIILEISKYIKRNKIKKIVGIDARGFIFGATLAYKHNISFVPVRKKGKLPGLVYKKKYKLEYGYDELEIQKETINKKDKVLIIDDLIATGGTASATAHLIRKTSDVNPHFFFVIDLYNLGGSLKLKKSGYKVTSLISTEG